MELGNPMETIDTHVYMCLALPTGEVIIGREFNTVTTLEHNGTYSCIAYLNGAPTVVSLPVIVYGELLYENICMMKCKLFSYLLLLFSIHLHVSV